MSGRTHRTMQNRAEPHNTMRAPDGTTGVGGGEVTRSQMTPHSSSWRRTGPDAATAGRRTTPHSPDATSQNQVAPHPSAQEGRSRLTQSHLRVGGAVCTHTLLAGMVLAQSLWRRMRFHICGVFLITTTCIDIACCKFQIVMACCPRLHQGVNVGLCSPHIVYIARISVDSITRSV